MTKHDTLLVALGTAENRAILRSALSERYNLLEAANVTQTFRLLEQNLHCIAAVLLDITVREKLDREALLAPGFARLLEQVPVIVITGKDDPVQLHTAFGMGAADAISLDYDPYAMLHRIENIVDLHLHKQQLEVMVEEQAERLRHSNDVMVDALSSIIEYRSAESGQHILRIRHFTKLLLEEVARCCPEYALTEQDIRLISSASALHDIGKISIPDAILSKPGKLTPEEMEIMRTHTVTGCQILRRLGNSDNQDYLRYAHNICCYHHERWDGGGYPEGLAGDEIPICAQIVGLADVYDALTTKRVYKDAVAFGTAVNMILKGECGAFSPKLLECFKHITGSYENLARAYADGLDPETEVFDTVLPAPRTDRPADSIQRTWAKYQALVHYCNAFLLELDLDQRLFHLIYNPYPDMISFQNIDSFEEMFRVILDELVVPEQRERMESFIRVDVPAFMREGLRRVNQKFLLRNRGSAKGELYEVTLLRINPTDTERSTLAVLLRRVEHIWAAPASETLREGMTVRCRFDKGFTLDHLAEKTAMLAGYSLEELQAYFGGQLLSLVVPEDREQVSKEVREQFARGTAARLEFRVRHKDGRVIWVLCMAELSDGENGAECIDLLPLDISFTHKTVDELNRQLERYEIILAQTENVLFEWDVRRDTISLSATWEKIFGSPPASSNVRATLLEGAFFHPEDLPLVFDRIANLEAGSPYEMVEIRVATAKGRYIWCRFRASAIRDADGSLAKIMGIIINIDEEKQAEQALQDQAERDALTKLLNKQAGRKYAEEYFHRFAGKISCAMLIIDLDDFKLVNDQHGHLFGDTVLTRVAREIRRLFRNQDIVARIGGDEFMVLMRGVSDRELVRNRCQRLIEIFREAFQNEHRKLPLGCSIGVALGPEHGDSYFDLFRLADQALYQAKAQGKDKFIIYDPAEQPAQVLQQRATALNSRIDSDDQPGLTNDNIVQYAFQRLYTSQDVDASIGDILAMMGQQLNVSRVYIFENSPDNRFCSNTYEWCNEGIPPELPNLQNISYETDIPNYDQNFNEQGIFYCPDITELPRHVYDIVAPQGIKSMLHCAIRDKGVFRGYIGFDECVTLRFWTQEQIRILTYFSEMLSVFLLKKQDQQKIAQRAAELGTILDNQNAWIYIIDPDTCELKYLNARTRELDASAAPGMRCYKALRGLDQRCENCPSLGIREKKNGSHMLHNEKFDLKVYAEATLIQWQGEESCLLTCRQIPDSMQVQNS